MRSALQALVVDDSEIQRIQIGGWLQNLNYEIHTAIDGKEALHLLTKNSYKIAMLDNAMPVLSGIDLVKAYYQYAMAQLVKQNVIKPNECATFLDLDNYKDKNILERSKELTREHFPVIIMLTAEPLLIDKDLAAYLGVNYWVIKPIAQSAFNALINAIEGRK